MKAISYQENGFSYVSEMETSAQLAKSKFNGTLQARITTVINTSWTRNGGKTVSSVFGHTSSGKFDQKKYISFMPLNDKYQVGYKEAVSNGKETEFIKATEEEIQKVIDEEQLRVVQFTSEKPIKTLDALGMISRHDKTIDDVAQIQGFTPKSGETIYTVKAVTTDKNPSAVIIDTFGKNITGKEFNTSNGINYHVNPESDLVWKDFEPSPSKGFDISSLTQELSESFNK